MLTEEEQKWAPIWRKAHEIAARKMPVILSGTCKQPGLAAAFAIFAVEWVQAEREACAKIADNVKAEHPGSNGRDEEATWGNAANVTAGEIAAAIRNRK